MILYILKVKSKNLFATVHPKEGMIDIRGDGTKEKRFVINLFGKHYPLTTL